MSSLFVDSHTFRFFLHGREGRKKGNALSGCLFHLLKLAVQQDGQDFNPEVSHIRVVELQRRDFSVSGSFASVKAKVGFDGCKAARKKHRIRQRR